MKVKIDTREKFNAITVDEAILAANMTAEFSERLLELIQKEVKNVVLILTEVTTIDVAFASTLLQVQQSFYSNHISFITCSPNIPLQQLIPQEEILEQLNYAPSYEEATDMVLMEEIERELLNEDE